MTTTSPPTRPPRRPASISSTTATSRSSPAPASTNAPSGTTLTAKGSISRTNPSPKAAPPVRRTTASSRPSSSLSNSKEGHRASTPSKLKESGTSEVEQLGSSEPDGSGTVNNNRDELLLRVQDLDASVSSLATENASLQTSLGQAETRITELYADQARTDEELAMRHELAEKLRSQLREFEKEKRDVTRRYNEQTAAFEAERQSFYDNEQHLKSRIQALTQTRRDTLPPRKRQTSNSKYPDDAASIVSEAEYPPTNAPRDGESSGPFSGQSKNDRGHGNGARDDMNSQDESGDDTEPAEMTALKLELSTLSTSHSSLQSTLHLLQSQLLDLQRVNAELQEENEGWKVLVQQRTLAGTFDILTLGGANATPTGETAPNVGGDDAASMRSNGRSALDLVPEIDESAYDPELQGESHGTIDPDLDPDLQTGNGQAAISGSLASELLGDKTNRESSPASRTSRRRTGTIVPDGDRPKGETLADLPITGPGLDLAAELGRAQNAEGFIGEGGTSTQASSKKILTPAEQQARNEVESLKVEVKNLKDANKALSLYASKIIDRIIATEGFEDVLAVDFQDKGGKNKSTTTKNNRNRPGNLMFGMSEAALGAVAAPRPTAPKEKLTTFESIGLSGSTTAGANTRSFAVTSQAPPPPPKPTPPADDPRRSRRSMSFDWRGFSLFGGSGSAEPDKKAPDLRPLTLRPGAATGQGLNASTGPVAARKLETMEDEEDRKERERLRATMRLMGIDPTKEQASPPSGLTYQPRPLNTFGGQTGSQTPPSPKTAVAPTSNRWSFFGRKNTDDTVSSGSSSAAYNGSTSPPVGPPASLTAEALQQAEAESHLAALDAREKVVKEEIAKGGSSGFTELSGLTGSDGAPRRRIGEEWRNRRSSSGFNGSVGLSRSRSLRNSKEGSEAGSASTVWSAGKDDD